MKIYEEADHRAPCREINFETFKPVCSQENGFDGTGPWFAYHFFANEIFIAGGWTMNHASLVATFCEAVNA